MSDPQDKQSGEDPTLEEQSAKQEEPEAAEKKEQTSDATTEEKPKKPGKFIFNCTKCGECCEKWAEIPIYFADLERWVNDGTLNYILTNPQISLEVKETFPLVQLTMRKKAPSDDEVDVNPSGCPLYDYDNKICSVYTSMPAHCAAYPLGYSGEKFVLVDKECPGLGNGTMTKEWLAQCRTRAQDHFAANKSTSALMPLLYNIILVNIMKKSQEAMDQLSDEDKSKLDDLLTKTRGETDSENNENETENE